jgi:hypothetical protein
MSIYLKSLLGLITFFSPVIIGTIHLARKQVKFDRSKGCICSHPYIFTHPLVKEIQYATLV